MCQRFWMLVAVGCAMGAVSACADGHSRDDPGVAPTLGLAGASGVSAEVNRVVSLMQPTGDAQVLSAVDTAVWAPFNDDGAALASDVGAGTPGPLGWRATGTVAMAAGTRYASFRDSTGVLHELRWTADTPGPWTRTTYTRAGRLALEQTTTWTVVDGGWMLADDAATYHLTGGVDVRIDLAGRRMRVASARIDPGPLVSGAKLLGTWLAPRPLAAQFHFSPCAKEWLGWGGAALLAEIAWGKFLRTKSYKDFKLATAATGAAGVALSKLVDCMSEQPDEPDPGN
jgi:hypothetical protein